ncbi:MAG: sigma-70 family RNA polymerase sigma factor [Gemmatimonadota bacterium]|nr:sigma-70 family RNA polymerase sigma factor [Gemmatimonadota bacterium]
MTAQALSLLPMPAPRSASMYSSPPAYAGVRDTDATDDVALVERLRRGDESALDVLLLRFWAPLVAYAERLADTRDAAEDIAQRTFYRVWERRADWRPAGSLRGLLYRVAHNLAVSERRAGQALERAARVHVDRVPHVRTPLDAVEERQLRARLERAIQALPERRRQVFVLRCQHDLSYKEIAQVMGTSTQTVANQLSHALSTLRVTLAHLPER